MGRGESELEDVYALIKEEELLLLETYDKLMG